MNQDMIFLVATSSGVDFYACGRERGINNFVCPKIYLLSTENGVTRSETHQLYREERNMEQMGRLTK